MGRARSWWCQQRKHIRAILIIPHALEDFSSANLQAACEAMGMDCLNLIFYYAGLGPTNIIVENKPKFRESWDHRFRNLLVTLFEAGSGPSFGYLVGWASSVRSLMTRAGGEEKFKKVPGANGFDEVRKLGSGTGINRPKLNFRIHIESSC